MKDGDFLFVLDVEVKGDVFKRWLVDVVCIWMIIVESWYDIKFILYINVKFYNCYLVGYFDDYLVWIVRYNIWEFCLVGGR